MKKIIEYILVLSTIPIAIGLLIYIKTYDVHKNDITVDNKNIIENHVK